MMSTIETMHAGLAAKGVKFLTFTTGSLSSSGEVIVAAVAGKKLRVLAFVVSTTAAGTAYQLRSGAATAIATWRGNSTLSPAEFSYCPVGWCETTAGAALELHELSGVASVLQGHLVYVEVG